MTRPGRQQAQHKLDNARRDLRHWTGKTHTATDPTSAATYRRGVQDAQRRVAEAERQHERHSRD